MRDFHAKNINIHSWNQTKLTLSICRFLIKNQLNFYCKSEILNWLYLIKENRQPIDYCEPGKYLLGFVLNESKNNY